MSDSNMGKLYYFTNLTFAAFFRDDSPTPTHDSRVRSPCSATIMYPGIERWS